MKLRLKYDRKDNNCQHFVKYLASRIRHTGKKIVTGEYSRVSMSSLPRGERNLSPVSPRREAVSKDDDNSNISIVGSGPSDDGPPTTSVHEHPRPTRRPFFLLADRCFLPECCAIWDFTHWTSQTKDVFDKAETLLFKPDTGWGDETQRQTEVHLAMQDSLTAYYQTAPGPSLSVWLHGKIDRKQWFEDVLLGYVFRD
jgi:hypothetical protein